MELKGKKIAFLGDSITQGAGVEDINNRYDNVLKRECELAAVYNYGIGGTRVAYQSRPSSWPCHDLYFCGRAYLISEDADVVIVYGGVNDYLHGDAPVGEIGDTSPATFAGAIKFLMGYLTERFNGKTVVFLTPARMCVGDVDGSAPSTYPGKKPGGRPLKEYSDVIKGTAKIYNIPVFDTYDMLGINPVIDEDREKYTADGLHFNDEGHKILAARLAEFLGAL